MLNLKPEFHETRIGLVEIFWSMFQIKKKI